MTPYHSPHYSPPDWRSISLAVSAVALLAVGCSEPAESPDTGTTDAAGRNDTGATADAGLPDADLVTYTEQRAPCADRNPQRNLYWGDLHVHTDLSFDAYGWEVRNGPEDAYRFARGESIPLPPLGADGEGTRTAKLERPLDFVALTDHAEYFGEVSTCRNPDSPAYNAKRCQALRDPGSSIFIRFSLDLIDEAPQREASICGEDNERCLENAESVWQRVTRLADEAYDRSPSCNFTAFPAYEYTNIRSGNNMHRNVIFRNGDVPDEAVSVFEEPRPRDLWRRLKDECLKTEGRCDVLAIPHNSNLSGGEMFHPSSVEAGEDSETSDRALAETRNQLEPLMEIFQHKGSMECGRGVSGLLGQPDELCSFEKVYQPPFEDCGDGIGSNSITGFGCVSRHNFLRGALSVGMEKEQELGVNPFKLGVIASTDTHNANAGDVREDDWPGHFGVADATPDARLDTYGGVPLTSIGVVKSPGGLAAVWAVENSRDAIFEALERRETYGTSGPRMAVRLFGGWEYPETLCDSAELLKTGYEKGTPMGGNLSEPPADADSLEDGNAPTFVVQAQMDPGTEENPGVPLQHIQIIKGWLGPDGDKGLKVYEVAGDPSNGATVDPETCQREGDGASRLCTVWTDPDFDPDQRAFYYARVLQNPTCRWHTKLCNSLPEGERDAQCDNEHVEKIIQERAWTSPIWYSPE